MKFWRVAVLILATAVLSSFAAGAYIPPYFGPPCEAFWLSDAVFVGQVKGAQLIQEGESYGPISRYLYSFDVQKVYRGEVGASAEVVTGLSEGDCGYSFRPGVTYLVYANYKGGVLRSGDCTRTRPLQAAQEDIAWLSGLSKGATETSIFGKVSQNLRTDGSRKIPLAGVTITLSDSSGQERQTVTNSSGAYEFRKVAPGPVVITPERASTTFTGARPGEPATQTVEMHAPGCAEVNFTAVTEGRIRGRVLNPDGSPVPEVSVAIQPADDPHYGRKGAYLSGGAYTSSDGYYEFSHLAAGSYIAVVSPSGFYGAQTYPRRFFPDVDNIAEARPIQVGEGEDVSNTDIHLANKLTPVIVEIQIIDPNGAPANRAHAIVRHPLADNAVNASCACSNGVAKMKLFAEVPYSIAADWKGPDGKWYCGGPVTIQPGATPRILLKLDRVSYRCLD